MRARTVIHIDAGPTNAAGLLRCDHPDGRVSFLLVDSETQVWITATAENFDLFADVIDALAARIRTEVMS